MADQNLIRDVSDTALWTAAYRADESERPDALFRDHLARRLAGDRGAEIAERVPGKATRYGVVLRTAVLDRLVVDAVADGSFDVVLDLAAGLDARPYRLELPARLRWIEVDVPSMVAYKDGVLADEVPRCVVERIPLDLADRDARRSLLARIAASATRVLVVTEGLLGYLAPEAVAELAEDLAAQPAFAWWMTDILGAQVSERVSDAAKDLKGGAAPVLFRPEENTAFFEPHGWHERAFADIFEESRRLGRTGAIGAAIHAITPLLPRKTREAFSRSLGVATLERTAG